MHSIIDPGLPLDPGKGKQIMRLSIVAIAFAVCTMILLLSWFLLDAAPDWVVDAMVIAMLISSHFGAKAYHLRYS